MRLRWTPRAADDLELIKNYLVAHRPSETERTILRLYDGIRSLRTMPQRGRPGRTEGTRELLFAPLPYIAVYRTTAEFVEVLHIHHTAQSP